VPLHPARADLPWDEVDGRVFVALPRRRTRVERWLSARLFPTPENVLITLEGHAGAFWRLADGTRTLDDIARKLAALPGDAARMDERALAFARKLAARGLLRLPERPEPASDTRQGLHERDGFRRHACRACGVRIPVRAPDGAFFLCPRCRRLNRLR
jgi:hypothetical protein